MKQDLRIKSLNLRRRGLSYSEILKEIPVAKSTLSLWLRSVNLSKRQKQRLSNKKLLASQRGGDKRRKQRLEITKQIKEQSILEITNINKRDLWLMGIMLYWAEGAKSKEHNPSQGVIFSNSDGLMIKLIIRWLEDCLDVPNERIIFDLYIHDIYKHRIPELKSYWALATGFPVAKFDRIYYKRDKPRSSRKNKGNSYWGQLRIKISKSTNLNRQIEGWIEGICIRCGVV